MKRARMYTKGPVISKNLSRFFRSIVDVIIHSCDTKKPTKESKYMSLDSFRQAYKGHCGTKDFTRNI
jgi:hypothetical protein